MAEIKLAKLPPRKPVKMTITVDPELSAALGDYAAIYAQTYGNEAKVAELVPYMLSAYLAADRGFAKARAEMKSGRS
ncbi:MAG: DUF2274 domain-containing protein [Pseudomonadota bacterium]